MIFLFFVLLIPFLFGFEGGSSDLVFNCLSHKTDQLDGYLDSIRFNHIEKTELCKYIEPNGTYLEIGSGGDPIAFILKNIPEGYTPTIIASDIDQSVLDLLPQRHPFLRKYLHSSEGMPTLKLMQLNATDLSAFPDGSLSGINASSIVHEILSYSGGSTALEKFFKESSRVLKEKGVLIYRDPEGVQSPYEMVDMELRTKSMKLFAHLFLCKFLDTKCTRLYDVNGSLSKVLVYKKTDLRFTIYKVGAFTASRLSYEQYLATPTHEIDFARKYKIHLPRQLSREIERHYLTFLHDCNPLVFVKFIPDFNSDRFHVIYLSQRIESKFLEFASKYHIHFDGFKISAFDKEKIDANVIQRMTHIENGIRIRFNSDEKLGQILNILENNGFDPLIYVQRIELDAILLDYRIFGLLYDPISKWFDKENAPSGKVSQLAAKWLKMEGEENYFYLTVDELIAQVGAWSFNEDSGYILCPISSDENRFVSRPHYETLLNESAIISNREGYEIEIKEGKRIIHFAKMSLEQALPIYSQIIEIDPNTYPALNEFTKRLLDRRSYTQMN